MTVVQTCALPILVQAVVVIVAFWVVLVNLLADLINQRLDPRLRLQ